MQRLVIQNADKIESLIRSYFKNNEEADFIHRLHGILLFLKDEKSSCDSIGLMFGNSPGTVSNWIKKIDESGDLNSLRTKPGSGRRPRLSGQQKQAIRQALCEPPEKSGVAANVWDGKSLSWYIEKEYGIALKVRRCQELFHELGFSLRRARPVVAKGNPGKKEAFKKTSGKTEK